MPRATKAEILKRLDISESRRIAAEKRIIEIEARHLTHINKLRSIIQIEYRIKEFILDNSGIDRGHMDGVNEIIIAQVKREFDIS